MSDLHEHAYGPSCALEAGSSTSSWIDRGRKALGAAVIASVAATGFAVPAQAANNASISRVQFAFDGACTAASPTTFGTSAQYTGATDDANGEDFVQIYHVDGNNTVVSRHTGSGTTHSAAVGQMSSVNAFTRIVATPATGPYTAVLWDSNHGTAAFDFDGGDTMDLNASQVIATYSFDMNALDSDCPGGAPADTTPPTVAAIQRGNPAVETTDADTLTWRVSFSEDVQNVDAADFGVTGTSATVSNVSAISGGQYDVTVSGGDLAGLVNTVVSLGFTGGQNIQDASGNALTNTTPTQINQTYTVNNVVDTTPPTVGLTASVNSPTNAPFTVTATFSEDVSGFDGSDLQITNGAASNLQMTSASVYTATVTPAADGDVIINVPAGAAQDGASNASLAATPVTIVYDTTAPTVAITSNTGQSVSGPFEAIFTFSETVTGFTAGDVTVGNGAVSDFIPLGGNVFTAMITPAADGQVTIDVAANAAQDAAGNNSIAATQFSILKTSDATPPDVTLTSTAGAFATAPFQITATFSEPVNGFDVSDFQITNGTASNFNAVSATVYTATITPGGEARVSVVIPPAAAQDAAGNPSTVSNVIETRFDGTPPSVELSRSLSADPLSGPVAVRANFSEIVTGFDISDFVVTNGTLSNFFAGDSGRQFSAVLTPTADGEVTINVAAGAAQDAAGNQNTAATQISFTADGTAPTVALTTTSADPVSGAFTLTATFSEDVTGFELSELTVGNGTAANFNATSGSVYTATITPTADGQVTVDVAAGVATDTAGNTNTAATQFTITTDGSPPTPTIGLPGQTVEGPFTASFTFDEDVTGFDVSDIAVTNGAASGFTATNARTYSATITPDTVGTLTVSLAQGAAQDGAGNNSTAASESLDVVFPSTNIALDFASTVVDPTTVSSQVALNNPGSQAFGYTAASDVTWATATPASGTIPGSGSLNLTIGLTAAADQLAAGTYNGTITVSSTSPSATIATIPVALTVAPRFGSIQIVATTPGGTQGNATFTYASADSDLNGLSLITASGTASSATFTKRFGTYDITQSLPAGWELDSLSCTGDTDGGSVIDLSAGRADVDLDANETIVCTFANSRDDAAVRLATQRAINNYLVRRGDRIVSAQPDIAARLRGRDAMRPGSFSADATRGEIRVAVNGSLSGMINHAKASAPRIPGDTTDDEQRFDVWFAADYSSISDNRAGDSAESEFGIVQLGVDYALDDDTIVGFMVQHDWMDETQETVATAAGGVSPAQIDGAGWMAGPYAARELENGIIVDVLALFGQSDNDINPLGFYTDRFETDRYLVRANISGEWADGPWRVRPSASLSHFEETQDAYTDSLGVAIPEQSVSIGRLTVGPEVAYRTDKADGSYWEFHGQLNANFDYDPATLMDATGRMFDTGQFRADAGLGVRGQFGNGAVASFEVNISGIGEDDFEASGARFEIRLPFGG